MRTTMVDPYRVARERDAARLVETAPERYRRVAPERPVAAPLVAAETSAPPAPPRMSPAALRAAERAAQNPAPPRPATAAERARAERDRVDAARAAVSVRAAGKRERLRPQHVWQGERL